MDIEIFQEGFALKPYIFSLMLIDNRCRTRNKKVDSIVNAVKKDRELFKFYVVTISKMLNTHCDLMVLKTKNKEYKKNIYGAYKDLKESTCFSIDGNAYSASLDVDGKNLFDYLKEIDGNI